MKINREAIGARFGQTAQLNGSGKSTYTISQETMISLVEAERWPAGKNKRIQLLISERLIRFPDLGQLPWGTARDHVTKFERIHVNGPDPVGSVG